MSNIPPNRETLLGMLALLLLATVPYLYSLGNGFVGMDDGLLITENPIIRGLTPATIAAAFSSYDPELYIPLTFLSYQLNYVLGGLQPFGYHLINLLLHASNVLLVAWIVLLLGCKRSTAFWIAAIFAVHPLNTEVVAWASARKDLVSSFFCLWSIGAYLKYCEEASRKWLLASLVLGLLGMLSKVTVIMLPAILFLIDWYMGRPISKRSIVEKIPFFLLGGIFLLVAIIGKPVTGSNFVWEKLLIAPKSVIFYLTKFFVPSNLSVLYPYTQPITLSNPDLLFPILGVILMSIAAVMLFLRKGWRLPLFAWGWYMLFLLPTFNAIVRGRNEELDVYFASDRYAYLPIIGLLFLLGMLIQEKADRFRTITPSLLTTIVLIFAALSFHQSLVWKDSFALFSQVVATYPNAYVAHTNLGTELYNRGDIDGAFVEYNKALKIRPNAVAYYNIGQILVGKGAADQAILSFRRAIESSPLHLDAHLQLARLLIASGQKEEARKVLQEAKELAPDTAEVEALEMQLGY